MKIKGIWVLPSVLFKKDSFIQILPKYLYEDQTFRCGIFKYAVLKLSQFFVQAYLWIFLNPRKGPVGNLDKAEVDSVYAREASTYDKDHHITTRGMDLYWRRASGWIATSLAKKSNIPLQILDLCTGTGLAVSEILKVTHEQGAKINIVGLDYNKAMLDVAKKNRGATEAMFVRGDATNLTVETPGYHIFRGQTFDLVTQLFGIGGISHQVAVFNEVLKVLKGKGHYFMIDMHRPIKSQPGEFPLVRWLRMPLFEAFTYQETTIPLALKRKWGWRDPTLDFYLLPYITIQEGGGFAGFDVIFMTVESERWWLALPVMPTARILCQKIELSPEEYKKRSEILNQILTARK